MRNYLGTLAAVAALGVATWAQAPAPSPSPAQTPPAAPSPAPGSGEETVPIPNPSKAPAAILPPTRYPRLELFAGGSYAEAGLFNAGHWAGLPGWDASLSLNATHWLGFVFDGGQYFGTSKIPVGEQAPFPNCGNFCPSGTTFNVTTREYNFLFGAQLSRRKYERWTPFAELMFGHDGVRGEATAKGVTEKEVSSGLALLAGGGLDYRINPRFALRLKADYLQTATDFTLLGKKKQDNFRVSVGIVIRSVHKKKRKLEDETQVEP